MIKSFCAKDLVGFKEVNLEFTNGLNVFSGPSGAGKSVLIDGILSTIGLSDAKALFAESEMQDSIFRAVKKDKSRLFYNDEPIAKKNLIEIAAKKILYLNANDPLAFSRASLLNLLDNEAKNEFDIKYQEYQKANDNLKKLQESSNQLEEKREFLSFEIAKIDEIN
ncbi:MAG: repair protein RecN, partial [Pseudomonadota bacterium]